MSSLIYNANLSKGTLKVTESRVICRLLLENLSSEQWQHAIVIENVLQKRSPVAAKTIAAYLKQRFLPLNPELWQLVRDGATDVATQATLAATVKQSRLVGDFLDTVVREDLRQFKTTLDKTEWSLYIEQCSQRDPQVSKWTEPVLQKLRQNVFHILAESGYIADTKSLKLQRVLIVPEVVEYLSRQNEDYVLNCLQVSS